MIDNCHYSFLKLSNKIFPIYLKKLKSMIAKPKSMDIFAQKGIGVKRLLANLNLKRDFTGCYVLLNNKRPIYIGISRKVINRLLQHVKGNTHFDASLAYRMSFNKFPHRLNRETAMKKDDFSKEFKKNKKRIAKCEVAYLEINNDLELYLFEACCAMEFDTKKWNTFRTH